MSTQYMNQVTVSRRDAKARALALGAKLRTSGQGLAFLAPFLHLRTGPLRAIPAWLRGSAMVIDSRSHWVADELRGEAALELTHQRLLELDLLELEASEQVSSAVLEPRLPEPALDRHMRLRRLVPGKADPFVVLALDLEFAILDVGLCPAILDGLTYAMPRTLDARRFLRARSADAQRRREEARTRLAWALRAQPDRAAAWARVSAGLVASYLDVIEAYGPAPARSLAA